MLLSFSQCKSPSWALQLTSNSLRPFFLFPTVSHSIFSLLPLHIISPSSSLSFSLSFSTIFFPFSSMLSIFSLFFCFSVFFLFFFLLQSSSISFLLFFSPSLPFSYFPLCFSSHPFFPFLFFSSSIYFISPHVVHGRNSFLALPSPKYDTAEIKHHYFPCAPAENPETFVQ